MTERIQKVFLAAFFLLLLFGLCACGPSQAEQQATITQIAQDVILTQTALAPTVTASPTPTFTASPTHTATLTLVPSNTPVPSETPLPDLVVLDLKVPMREGHGWSGYPLVAYLFEGDTPAVIGRDLECDYLKVQDVKGNTGWIEYDPQTVEIFIDCGTLPVGSFRPFTGYTVLDHRESDQGLGELEASNGLAVDGVILLVDAAENPLVAFYIRGGEDYTLTKIPDGNYWLYFSTGEEWIGGENRFTQNVRRQKFEDLFDYYSSGGNYTIWSITLHAVAGGSAETETLSEGEFPSLSD